MAKISMHFQGLGLLLLLLGVSASAEAGIQPVQPDAVKAEIPERIMGRPDAPVTVEEYVSFTCSHCADFYNDVLPKLEKDYVETGKVKFILRDFPLDGVGLKASSLARCMPADQYYAFVKVLFKNQKTWAVNDKYEEMLIQYAKLGGLSDEKARACINDKAMQEVIVAQQTLAGDQLKIQATPTFVINNGAETLRGAQPAGEFAKVFDRLLKQ